jgi:DNA-binding SARP family transcriptional activator
VTGMSDTFIENYAWDSAGNRQWQDTVSLLQSIQDEFRGTRRQLDQVNRRLIEQEARVNQQLQSLGSLIPNSNTLRLAKYNLGNPAGRLGAVVLGGVSRPTPHSHSAQIEIRCLGRFEARSAAGQVEHWHSQKSKSVLQYLLIQPHQPTFKDTLVEALWPAVNAQAANNSLKAAVHSLRLNFNEITRGLLDAPVVLFSEGSYRLNPEVNFSIDVEEFEKLRANGRRLEKELRMAEAMSEFEKAEALYRGDYLEDELYAEWTLLKREALKDNYLIMLSKLAEYCLQTYRYEDCLGYSQKILTKDPCREDAYRYLIQCHLSLNQKNRALRWFEICLQTLKAQLDSLPEKETMMLGESILSHNTSRE